MGVSWHTLYRWQDQLLDNHRGSTVKKSPINGEADKGDTLRAKVKVLEKRVHELQVEHDILVKASEILKEDHGVNPQTPSNREKPLLVDALTDSYRLRELLAAVQLPRISYHYQREALQRPDKYVVDGQNR